MLPQIRYTKAADGTHIAFWDVGEGPPLVYLPATPLSHVQLEWEMPACRRWYEALIAAGHRLIRYDARGTGLSDRESTDYSLDAQCGDLQAVIEAAGLETCTLFASGDSGMVAVRWTVEHPEQVDHVALWCSWASRSRISSTPQTKTLRALIDQDWTIYTETAARVLLGWADDDTARQFAAFFRECTSPEVLRASVPAVYEWDVTELLARLRCPVLVMQRDDMPAVPTDVSRELARVIPDARLVLLDGRSPLPFQEDTSSLLTALSEFLGVGAPPASYGRRFGAPVTILFTDMQGSTALTQRLGDERAQEVLHTHNRIVREALAAHGGREVKHTGDGLMTSFPSASRALECAVMIQQRIAAYVEEHPDVELAVRVGLNAGEPVAEAGDYFGTSVQLAARICEMAGPGEVLVAGVVRDLAAGKGFLFADRGETVPRGFEDSVHVYQVRW